MAKELFIMRHAKSSWKTDIADISRPLSKRGIDAAQRIGDGLARLGWVPEKILVSPAKRTRQTCEIINLGTPVEEERRIYEASLGDLFDVLTDVPENINKLMIIGHNPALEELLLHLAPAAERQKNGKLLTTANVARIGLEGSWSSLNTRRGTLLGHIRPKDDYMDAEGRAMQEQLAEMDD